MYGNEMLGSKYGCTVATEIILQNDSLCHHSVPFRCWKADFVYIRRPVWRTWPPVNPSKQNGKKIFFLIFLRWG